MSHILIVNDSDLLVNMLRLYLIKTVNIIFISCNIETIKIHETKDK